MVHGEDKDTHARTHQRKSRRCWPRPCRTAAPRRRAWCFLDLASWTLRLLFNVSSRVGELQVTRKNHNTRNRTGPSASTTQQAPVLLPVDVGMVGVRWKMQGGGGLDGGEV